MRSEKSPRRRRGKFWSSQIMIFPQPTVPAWRNEFSYLNLVFEFVPRLALGQLLLLIIYGFGPVLGQPCGSYDHCLWFVRGVARTAERSGW